jgi:hypothetical protein
MRRCKIRRGKGKKKKNRETSPNGQGIVMTGQFEMIGSEQRKKEEKRRGKRRKKKRETSRLSGQHCVFVRFSDAKSSEGSRQSRCF